MDLIACRCGAVRAWRGLLHASLPAFCDLARLMPDKPWRSLVHIRAPSCAPILIPAASRVRLDAPQPLSLASARAAAARRYSNPKPASAPFTCASVGGWPAVPRLTTFGDQ